MLKKISLTFNTIHANISEFNANDIITGFLVTNDNAEPTWVVLSETCSRSDSYVLGDFNDPLAAVDAITDIYTEISESDIKASAATFVSTVNKYQGCTGGCYDCKKRAAKSAMIEIIKIYHLA